MTSTSTRPRSGVSLALSLPGSTYYLGISIGTSGTVVPVLGRFSPHIPRAQRPRLRGHVRAAPAPALRPCATSGGVGAGAAHGRSPVPGARGENPRTRRSGPEYSQQHIHI